MTIRIKYMVDQLVLRPSRGRLKYVCKSRGIPAWNNWNETPEFQTPHTSLLVTLPHCPLPRGSLNKYGPELCVAKCTKHTSGLSFSFDANSSLVFHELLYLTRLTGLNPSSSYSILTRLTPSWLVLPHPLHLDPSRSTVPTHLIQPHNSKPHIPCQVSCLISGVNDIKLALKTLDLKTPIPERPEKATTNRW